MSDEYKWSIFGRKLTATREVEAGKISLVLCFKGFVAKKNRKKYEKFASEILSQKEAEFERMEI